MLSLVGGTRLLLPWPRDCRREAPVKAAGPIDDSRGEGAVVSPDRVRCWGSVGVFEEDDWAA